VAASCERQTEALAAIGPVDDLAQAKRALRRTVAVERRALEDLRPARSLAGTAALVQQLELAVGDGRRFLASIEDVDPTQSMTPLQTGPSGARRAVERGRRLARATCRLGR
jgi:hypothetical protein